VSETRKADPARAIIAQLVAALIPAKAEIISAKSVDWASATFTGARHEFEIMVSGDDADGAAKHFVQHVGDNNFTIGGHIVADIVAEHRGSQILFVEALSVEAD
jgi:hypothetical protein